MTIINLDKARHEREQPPAQHAACECGETWFELRGGPTGSGAVCMTRDGCITGYAGAPCCVGCGKPLAVEAPAW
ncbi:hypothetical protein HEP85_37730 [Streptomyces sp. RPA4-2]|uniref:hypothetical protein n=1 Tax=Streptomyces sp. RPA4-2 TaxID=2721244 RepID=UPI00143EE62E|nr:hypothetical protein [Streptomyces sp. RPA4-2]QIY66250.1 hypothetical protein HEP85_37730 [Streptomyces sp. RPA4-2]